MLGQKRLIYITLLILTFSSRAQIITEVSYQGRPHFRIISQQGEYLYDRNGGGFSSIMDPEGIEWVGYQPGKGRVPESAALDFRGLPNLVFRGEDSGAGHPGFDRCISELVAPNKIRTNSVSGKWAWEWRFYKEGALLEVLKVDTGRAYWFLYEGIPGGSFDPNHKFWGNDLDGIRFDRPVLKSDSIARGSWRWAYFGDKRLNRSLAVIQLTPDEEEDNFSYMGSSSAGILSSDGMVVFGFGRSGSAPALKGENKFFIAFTNHGSKDPRAIHNQIKKLLKKF